MLLLKYPGWAATPDIQAYEATCQRAGDIVGASMGWVHPAGNEGPNFGWVSFHFEFKDHKSAVYSIWLSPEPKIVVRGLGIPFHKAPSVPATEAQRERLDTLQRLLLML